MPKYLLDSGPLAAYLSNHRRAVNLVSPWIANKEVVTSTLAYAEVHELILGSPNYAADSVSLSSLMFGPIPMLNLDLPTLHRYGQIRRYLRPLNQLIGDVDTLIASTAIEHGLTIVTRDSDFQRVVPLGLKIHVY